MSGLRERLLRLRPTAVAGGDLHASPESASAAVPLSLAERLQRLDPACRRAMRCREPDEQALAEGLGAEVISPGVLLLERRQPLNRRHGRWRPADCIGAMPALCVQAPSNADGWTLIDTETSGLAGGTGTWVFTCGLGRLEGDVLLLRQWLLTRLDMEQAMLALVDAELAKATLLISFNGKAFDLPLLAARFRLAGLVSGSGSDSGSDSGPDWQRIEHLDLLHSVRRAFARQWPDCRLASAEQHLLGFRRQDDLPGAEAPSAWLDWLRRADGRRLGAVLRHNRLDLISLAALVPALAAVERDPVRHGADVAAVARHRLRLGDVAGAADLLHNATLSIGCDARLLLASLYRRRGDWALALSVWETLALTGEPEAVEALAKYHEHRGGDLHRALQFARRLPAGPSRTQRCARLERKLNDRAQLPLVQCH